MTDPTAEIYQANENIFAELGVPDPEEALLKSAIVAALHRLIKDQRLTQTAAARQLRIGQPDLSHLLRGRFRGYSIERLMRMLTMFEQDVEITIRPHAKSGEAGQITIRSDAA